ncbi:MAG: hypothetical protein ACXAC7_03095 [Candidatus Hodarchaeales archaeon]|jgi:2-phospho-L-lactate guanylyltransferase (CobY/MobA/RfbA family)
MPKRKDYNRQIICLIPLKDIKNAKTRLRKNWPQNLSNGLIQSLYEHTVKTVNQVCNFGVVSPSLKLLKWAQNHGAVFTFKDKGIDLNQSLKNAIDQLVSLKKWSSICILMGDLPLLSKEGLIDFISQLQTNACILPVTNDKKSGTSGLYFPIERWPQISLQFGDQSFDRFQKLFKEQNIVFDVHYSFIGRDFDVMEDFKYLHDYKNKSRFVLKFLNQNPREA